MSVSKPSNSSAAAVSPGDDIRTLAEFRYTLRQFLRFSEDAATDAGISPQQHQALLAIKGFRTDEGISVGDLAERLQIRHHSAVGLVDRLASTGLIARVIAADDRRKVLLDLTEEGERVLARLSTSHRLELRRIGPTLRELLGRLDELPED